MNAVLSRTGQIVFCLSTLAASAQTTQYDLSGWSKARWGMTESEIREAFKDEPVALAKPEEYGPEVATICLEKVVIDGDEFKAWFMLDPKSKRLKRVLIKPKSTDPGERDIVNPERILLNLEKLLTEKYGPATLRRENDPKDRIDVYRMW